ncbi:hypothetical protein D3C74_424450 [compost metagenome]
MDHERTTYGPQAIRITYGGTNGAHSEKYGSHTGGTNVAHTDYLRDTYRETHMIVR